MILANAGLINIFSVLSLERNNDNFFRNKLNSSAALVDVIFNAAFALENGILILRDTDAVVVIVPAVGVLGPMMFRAAVDI